MKTAISVPDGIFAAGERAAAKLGISRSQFYARAAQRWIDELESDELSEQINASLRDAEDDQHRAFTSAAAAETFTRSEW